MPKNRSQFLPRGFSAPRTHSTALFHFRVLEEAVEAEDYEAVMSSQKRLQGIFGPDSTWPAISMTRAQNAQSLKEHRYEFEHSLAFAYSVVDAQQTRCLGSIYIDPSRAKSFDCEVYLWIRDDSVERDDDLYCAVREWLSTRWPLKHVAYPGRSISWPEWQTQLALRA